MRIGIVTQAYYPVLGGVTEHVWHLGQELQRRGHTVTIITGSSHQAEDRGLRVIRLGMQIPMSINGANVSVTLGWKLGRRLQQIEQAEKFDLVHIQSPLDPGLPLIATKAMRSPKIGTYHSYSENPIVADRVYKIFRGVFNDAFEKLAGHIAVSPSAEEIVRRYFPEADVHVIPNGVDITHFSPEGDRISEFDDDVFTVLYVGRMDPRKGAKYLFMALPYLEKALPKYRVVVVGTGWMQKYYDAYIPLWLRKRVRFMGYASPDDLPKYYRTADVYCSPATGGESFGIVLTEAMASGTAVVASDIGGYRWVVTPGQEGLLVPPRNPQHLANALITLANDPDRRKQMGQAGLVTAKKYSWNSVTDQIEQVYRKLLKG